MMQTQMQRQMQRQRQMGQSRGLATQLKPLGFIGLGHMGSKMVANLSKEGRKVVVFDASAEAVMRTLEMPDLSPSVTSGSIADIAATCEVVFSMLPNDAIVSSVSDSLMSGSKESGNTFLHISCSTISPSTARALAIKHTEAGIRLATSPVFARPDGISKRQATWMVGGAEADRRVTAELLGPLGNVVDMGDDVGAANVVKLCGNFLIAASIEAISESAALAEKNGVDREKVMGILSSSIFDCLIYKGYGQRVTQRDHRPGGFSLALGLKDVSLVSQAARETDTPMPFLSVLLDRYVSAKAKGRGEFDWSAIGLGVAEEAGIDVTADVKRTERDVKEGNLY